MTPQQIIDTARAVLQDSSDTLRQSDVELLGYVNEGILDTAALRPLLFLTVGTVVCTPGTCDQSMAFDDAATLVDVQAVVGGQALTRFDRRVMDAFSPSWRTHAEGPAQQWGRTEGDPLGFVIYPKAPAGQSLLVQYVKVPRAYGLNETVTELPDVYRPALADYVVYRSESKDDEHVLSARAQAHFNSYMTKIGAKNGTAV